MTDEQKRNASGAANLCAELEDYCNMVKIFLEIETLDDNCQKACAHYKQRGIPASLAASNIRRALSSA